MITHRRKYLRDLREDCGLSRRDMARAMGITEAYYGQIELGRRLSDLPLSMITKLSEVLGVSSDEIFRMENEYQRSIKAVSA